MVIFCLGERIVGRLEYRRRGLAKTITLKRMKNIESRQNEKIRLARVLRQRKKRDSEGRFLIEGLFHLGEALEAKVDLDFVLVVPSLIRNDFGKQMLGKIEATGISLFEIEAELMDSLSQREKSSGFLGVARSQYMDLKDIDIAKAKRLVALINPQDPGNVGSILRSVDANGSDGILLLDRGVDAYHPSAVRAGMGAHFWKQIARGTFDEFTKWARDNHYQILGSSAKEGLEIQQIQASLPYVLLLGSEREGLSDSQKGACDQIISLRMLGRNTSLNLSVAAGILLFRLREMEIE